MKFAIGSTICLAAMLTAAVPAIAASNTPAKYLFSKVDDAAPLEVRPIGYYTRGCVAGAVALPADGPAWQAMRLSRNRNWGTPELVDVIQRLATDARTHDGWPGLLVGDLGQPRGGPTPTSHVSHQSGLDVDIWFDPMPKPRLTVEERETISALSVLVPGTNFELNMDKWPDGLDRLLKRAASYPEVQRILVNPGIKKLLCARAGDDRDWLRKIRPWYKHDDHFHMRLRCPPGVAGCRGQEPPPAGDGCGDSLAYWLGPAPWKPAPKPTKPSPPPREIMLSDLPAVCSEVLTAGDSGVLDPIAPPLPPKRPATFD